MQCLAVRSSASSLAISVCAQHRPRHRRHPRRRCQHPKAGRSGPRARRYGIGCKPCVVAIHRYRHIFGIHTVSYRPDRPVRPEQYPKQSDLAHGDVQAREGPVDRYATQPAKRICTRITCTRSMNRSPTYMRHDGNRLVSPKSTRGCSNSRLWTMMRRRI